MAWKQLLVVVFFFAVLCCAISGLVLFRSLLRIDSLWIGVTVLHAVYILVSIIDNSGINIFMALHY